MSYFIKFLKYIDKSFDIISDNLSIYYKQSKLQNMFSLIFLKIKQSFLWSWLIKPEEDIDAFETSKIVSKSLDIGMYTTEKLESYAKESSSKNIFTSLAVEFNMHPVYITSILVFSAAAANMILWLIFNEFSISGLLLRISIIIISFLGLNIKADINTIIKSSYFLNHKLMHKR